MDTNGVGKITALEEYSETSRAAKGNQLMALKDSQCGIIKAIEEGQTNLFLSVNNKSLVLKISDIPVQSRTTSGVILIRH